MDHMKRRILLGALKVLNLGLMIMSFAWATDLLFAGPRSGVSLSAFLAMRISLQNFGTGILILLTWHLVFSLLGLYQSRRLASLYSLAYDTAKAATLASVVFVLLAHAFGIRMATPKFVMLLWLLSTATMTGARAILWYVLKAVRRHGRNLRHLIIVGTNPRAVAFADKLSSTPELGYHVLGFVDHQWPGFGEFCKTNHTLCSNFEDLPVYLRENVVDEVAIYLPLQSFYKYASSVVSLCEQHGIAMRFDSDIFNLKIARLHTDDLEGHSHIAAKVSWVDGWAGVVKRATDITVSSILLILSSPMLVLAALLVKATSKGPVFFLQERVGLNKRRFRIFKFRTMVVNAEEMMADLEKLNEATGPVFKIKNDPRLTRVGSFLRRTSIDELPQLLNVLKGDMSLVGPRPLPVRDYEGFSEDWQRRRFSIRPGITCLWQVGGRSSISFEQWMRLDLQYMDQWSLWLDLKILVRTVPAVLKGTGAA
jgi:exopolysaccharide biosynthesis polyprenyl glycosylphosphotransferase